MDDHLFFENKKYISAASAAALSGFAKDHIGRLCRAKKISGVQFARKWYVEEDPFKSYLILHTYGKSLKRDTLAKKRSAEYILANDPAKSPLRPQGALAPSLMPRSIGGPAPVNASNIHYQAEQAFLKNAKNPNTQLARAISSAPAGVSQAALHAVHVPIHTITPFVDIAHRLLALTFAFLLTFGLYAYIYPDSVTSSIEYARGGIESNLNSLTLAYSSISRPVELVAKDEQKKLVAGAASSHPNFIEQLYRDLFVN